MAMAFPSSLPDLLPLAQMRRGAESYYAANPPTGTPSDSQSPMPASWAIGVGIGLLTWFAWMVWSMVKRRRKKRRAALARLAKEGEGG